MRIVAQHADIWHSFSDPQTLEHKLSVLRGHCDAVGRNLSDIELSGSAAAASPGEPDIERLEQHRSLGVSLFVFGISAPDPDLATVEALLAWRDSLG